MSSKDSARRKPPLLLLLLLLLLLVLLLCRGGLCRGVGRRSLLLLRRLKSNFACGTGQISRAHQPGQVLQVCSGM
jgi:hypothetical protein